MSKKVKDDYEPGDEECSSCSGIALFSSKLINGVAEPYRCVGVRRTVKAKITPAQLDEFEDQHAVREPRNVVSIGYSISSKRMDRKGYAPINLAGLVVAFENDSSSRKPAPRKDVTTPPKTGNMMAERPMQAANTDIIEEKPKIPISIEGAVWSFVKMMERGSNKQLAAMNKLYVRASTNFPQKFYRSSGALYASCGRTAGYAMNDIRRLFAWGTSGK